MPNNMIQFLKNIFKRKSPAKTAGDVWLSVDADTKKRATMMSSHVNAEIHRKYIIPTKPLSDEEVKTTLAELIADYKDNVVFDEKTGGFIVESNRTLVKEENDTVIRYLQDNKHNQA